MNQTLWIKASGHITGALSIQCYIKSYRGISTPLPANEEYTRQNKMSLHSRALAYRRSLKRDVWDNRYIGWRIYCLRRDKYTCRRCGSQKHLHVHHIKPWAKDKLNRFSSKNGLTLCKDCHSLIHPWMKINAKSL